MAKLIRGRHRSVLQSMVRGFNFLNDYDQRVRDGLHTNDNTETFPDSVEQIAQAGSQVYDHFVSLLNAEQ